MGAHFPPHCWLTQIFGSIYDKVAILFNFSTYVLEMVCWGQLFKKVHDTFKLIQSYGTKKHTLCNWFVMFFFDLLSCKWAIILNCLKWQRNIVEPYFSSSIIIKLSLIHVSALVLWGIKVHSTNLRIKAVLCVSQVIKNIGRINEV